MSADRLQDTVDWLVDGARSASDSAAVLAELCDRLVALGIPLWRVGVFVRTLHPDLFGRAINFGLALHVGNVLYGNIGGGNRLDFTCIGPAVNLAARLEKLTSGLGRTILASPDFAQHSPDAWDDIGEVSVAGFSRAQRVFGLRDEADHRGEDATGRRDAAG